MERPLDMPAPQDTSQVGHTVTQPVHTEYQGEGPKMQGANLLNSDSLASDPLKSDTTPLISASVSEESAEKGSESVTTQNEKPQREPEAQIVTSGPDPKRHKLESGYPYHSQVPFAPSPYGQYTPIQSSIPDPVPPQLHAQYPNVIPYPIPNQQPPIYYHPMPQGPCNPQMSQIPHMPNIPLPNQPLQTQQPLQPGEFIQNASYMPLAQLSTLSINGDANVPADSLNKKQLERLEKQKQREAERISKEIQKAEQLRIKNKEREKKELEKKLKREALEAEKEQKREQERLRKEEKRRKQEEEKAKKEQERKKREEERQEREEEKRKEEERKKKEERNQMKISNFFTVKKATPVQASSVESTGSPGDDTKRSKEVSLYESDFLPFFQKRNVSMPSFQLLNEDLERKKSAFDEALAAESKTLPTLSNLLQNEPKNVSSIRYTTSEELVEALNSSQTSPKQLYQLVQNLPNIKYLQFYENAKPPYVGTWCSKKHLTTVIPVADPLDRSLTGFDYDYDSDLDWQDNDEGEGEDLGEGEDAEEEDEDVEEDEMDDFVDNNDSVKKRGHLGPLQSICEWNDGISQTFDDLKYERLDFDIDFPIDPFKNYWNSSPSKNTTPALAKERRVTSLTQLGTPVKAAAEPQTPNILTPSKPVIKDAKVLESLREFVKKNSDFSIGTLSELAKREFKAYTKSILKHTIQEVASYNKKSNTWEIKPMGTLT